MSNLPAKQDAPPVVGVIDPDPVARTGLKTLLRGLGIDVSTFDSAESFLLAANGRHIGCLIVDLLLPGMSGLELLRRLRVRNPGQEQAKREDREEREYDSA